MPRIAITNRRRAPRLPSPRVRALAQAICAGVGRPAAALSLVLTGDAEIAALNGQFRGKPQATDVLSFPQAAAYALWGDAAPLGDVVVSLDTAARQADALGHDLDTEVQRLLVHGVLHLIGHDHVHGGPQARRMRAEERRLMALLARLPAHPQVRRPAQQAPARAARLAAGPRRLLPPPPPAAGRRRRA